MVFRTCLVCVACLLIPAINAEPQSQPQHQQHQQRLVYSNNGNGPPPRPQEQYSQGNYPQAVAAAQSQAYQRPGPTYQAGTKPVSIHQLPNPSPIQSPLARQQQQQQQQSGGLARQGAPSIVPSRQVSAEAVNNYNQAPGPIQPRPRFPLPPQNKYSSQVKSSQGQGSKQNQLTSEELEYEEEKLREEAEQEPDRLTLLLQESKFSCSGKKDGYYADEGLHCEVFHYCQDGGKHSWMCPNNFAFHQVHLICVPPTSDNICKQSASYHFVNDYLYRPINEKEAQASNTSLKYADRYYPDGYTPGTPLEEMFANTDYQQVQHEPRAPHSHRQHGSRPNSPPNNRNVFYSPESINIPLSQRRPPPARAPPAAAPKSHNSQQQQSYEEYEDEEY